jgi:hypothetical protein
MVHVLLGLNIILKEDLDLWRHLWSDVFQEQACDNTEAAETE